MLILPQGRVHQTLIKIHENITHNQYYFNLTYVSNSLHTYTFSCVEIFSTSLHLQYVISLHSSQVGQVGPRRSGSPANLIAITLFYLYKAGYNIGSKTLLAKRGKLPLKLLAPPALPLAPPLLKCELHCDDCDSAQSISC